MHLLVVGSAFHRCEDPLHQVDNDFFRRADDQAAQRCAANCDELRGMNQRAYVTAGHREAAQYGTDNDNDANDDEHESVNSE